MTVPVQRRLLVQRRGWEDNACDKGQLFMTRAYNLKSLRRLHVIAGQQGKEATVVTVTGICMVRQRIYTRNGRDAFHYLADSTTPRR